MRTLCLAALALAALHSQALAEDGIVLESYTGARPDDASAVLGPMLAELATKNFVGGVDGVGLRFETSVSRAAGSVAGLPADFADQVDKGHKAYFGGKFDDAIKVLVPLVDAARANTGAFATTPALREKLTKATIALALSYNRIGDASSARTAFGELVRSAADAQVPKGTYGPEANALFEQVKKELTTGPKGRLLVKLASEDAEVFINERLERTGTTVKELIPGDYRVVVQRRGAQSRNHRVAIKPGAEVSITVDLPFDALVHTAGWVGFEFPTQAEREKAEATYAQQFASRIGAGGVIVVGFDQVRGRPAIVGSLISTVNGRELRRASLALDPPPSEDRLRALARFLGGEQATPDIDVQISGEAAGTVVGTAPGTAPPQAGRWGGWKWITSTAAVAGLGVGAYLLKIDGTCPDGSDASNCPNLYNVTAPAWSTLGAGAVFAGITVYLFVSGGPKAPARSAYVIPTDGGAMAGYATRF